VASLALRNRIVVSLAALILVGGVQPALAFPPLPLLKKDKGPKPVTERQARKADAIFEKGHRALDEGKGTEAEKLYREAIELNPEEPRYHRQLALLLTDARRGQEAEREALLAVGLDPEDWRSLLVLGRIYHLMGRYREENNLYKKATELMPAEEKPLKDRIKKAMSANELELKKALEKERKRHEESEAAFKKSINPM